MSAESRTPAVGGATHRLRSPRDATTMMGAVALALVPCFVVGTWNVGRQAAMALEGAGLDGPPGWRGELLGALGVAAEPGRALACLLQGSAWVLPLLAVSIATTLAWEHGFATWRRQAPGHGAVVTALVFTALLPPGTPLWQAVLGASFGMLFGKLVFGGAGYNPLNPAACGLALLWVSWPQAMNPDALFPGLAGYRGTAAFAQAAETGVAALGDTGLTFTQALLGALPGRIAETSALACLVGAAWLVQRRVASWRVISGVLLGAALVAGVTNLASEGTTPGWPWHLVVGGLAFVAVFVATDPVSSAATQAGRWLYGLLIGALVVLLRVAGPGHPDGVVPAVLLANVAAPLIDHAVVQFALHRRLRDRRKSHA